MPYAHVFTHIEQFQFGEYSVLAIGILYFLFSNSNIMKEKEETIETRIKQKHNNKKPSRPLKKHSLDVTSISRVREPGERKGRKSEDRKEARRRRRKTQQEKKSRKKLLIQRHRNAVAKRNYEKSSSLPHRFSPGISGVIMQERSKYI